MHVIVAYVDFTKTNNHSFNRSLGTKSLPEFISITCQSSMKKKGNLQSFV